MQGEMSYEKLVNRNSNPVRISTKKFESFLSSPNKVGSDMNISSTHISSNKQKSMPFEKSVRHHPLKQYKTMASEVTRCTTKVRNTISSKSSNPFELSKTHMVGDASELMEFIELEDFCRRSTVISKPKSMKKGQSPKVHKNHQKEKDSQKSKSGVKVHTKSRTTKQANKRRINDTSHLVKKMSITISKDHKIIYS